jgi:phosphoribosyl-ATP pyrophosphohydrolase
VSERPIVTRLLEVIAERKTCSPEERSYVASLLRGGPAKIVGKIAEEACEVVAAGTESGESGRAHLTAEAADLVFHALVLLGRYDVAWSDVEAELARRFGVSGIAEKESRGRGAGAPDAAGTSAP